MTKILFLIFTVLFSASVLGDCCNFEVEESVEQCATIDHDQNDNCGDESQHTESQHCHCSPINHLKILPQLNVVKFSPALKIIVLIPVSDSHLTSDFESFIFHPPIA
ncbi:MAG: hypothetical protein V4598_00350 [Bdellovibrionota bacterium]